MAHCCRTTLLFPLLPSLLSSSPVMPPVGVPPPPHILSTLPSHGSQEDPRTRSIMPHGVHEELRTRSMSSPVRTLMGGAGAGIDKELSLVMSGITEFKTELLQLHVLVSIRRLQICPGHA